MLHSERNTIFKNKFLLLMQNQAINDYISKMITKKNKSS